MATVHRLPGSPWRTMTERSFSAIHSFFDSHAVARNVIDMIANPVCW